MATEAVAPPEPSVVKDIRPILVDAMVNHEPGSPDFDLAAFLHDQLEEYLGKLQYEIDNNGS